MRTSPNRKRNLAEYDGSLEMDEATIAEVVQSFCCKMLAFNRRRISADFSNKLS